MNLSLVARAKKGNYEKERTRRLQVLNMGEPKLTLLEKIQYAISKMRRVPRNILGTLIRNMPKRLQYLIAVDLIAKVTVNEYSNTVVPELKAMDALGRFEKEYLNKRID